MKITYDKEADAIYIQIREAEYGSTKEVAPGLILDFDAAGVVTGIELLFASKRIPIKELIKQKGTYVTSGLEYSELYAEFLRYEKERFSYSYISNMLSWLINPKEGHGLKGRLGDSLLRGLGWTKTVRRYEVLFKTKGHNIPFDFLIKTPDMDIFFELITDTSKYDESTLVKKLNLLQDIFPGVKEFCLAIIFPQKQIEDSFRITERIVDKSYLFGTSWEDVAESLEVIAYDANTYQATKELLWDFIRKIRGEIGSPTIKQERPESR